MANLERQKEALLAFWERDGTVADRRVIAAFKAVPREDFVEAHHRDDAYVDTPLPIRGGQTISQPTAVMLMLQALEVAPGMLVLEVGAGSGYNAALLGKLVGAKGKVFTTEIIPALAICARENLARAGARNVTVLETDGSNGVPREAPFDRIIVTAAAPAIPPPLVDQLADDGIILIPVGGLAGQTLIKGRKRQGTLETESLGAYAFVPLRGVYGLE